MRIASLICICIAHQRSIQSAILLYRVYPSVCPWDRDSVSKQTQRPGSSIILVSLTRAPVPNSEGTPSAANPSPAFLVVDICDRLTVVISTSQVWNLLRTEGVHLHTPALQTGTHFLLTLETIVFLFHLLGATSKPFSSLSTAQRVWGSFYKNVLHKFTVIINHNLAAVRLPIWLQFYRPITIWRPTLRCSVA